MTAVSSNSRETGALRAPTAAPTALGFEEKSKFGFTCTASFAPGYLRFRLENREWLYSDQLNAGRVIWQTQGAF